MWYTQIGGNLNIQFFDAEPFDQVVLNRLAGLGTQAANALVSVVARQGGEVHAGDGTQQPRRLPVFFYGAARDVALRPTFDRAGVDPNLLHPIEIQRNAVVRYQGTSRESSDRSV